MNPADELSEPLPHKIIRSARRKKTVSARLVDGVVEVRMPMGLTAEQESAHVVDLVAKIQRKRSTQLIDLEQRARELAADYDLPLPSEIRWVSNQNQRWGSCTIEKRSIRMSDRMAGFPAYVVDYVLLHELTHLVDASHGPNFHQLMDRFPQSERAEGYLEAASHWQNRRR